MNGADHRPTPNESELPRPEETTADIVTFQAWQGDEAPSEPLPVRYDIREGDHGRYLRCKEAPGIGVAIDRSYAFSEAEARKLGERVILLDGAGQFGPLIDNTKQVYNLDHHDDCLRAFTLAACEQALVLVLKGLELDKGDWRILANEPDLDTVFAIWVLLNHRRLRGLSPEARDSIVPLLRLEGAIDANGYEIADYCGLPTATLAETRAKLEPLFAAELAVKERGAWGTIDPVAYTMERLIDIDHLVYDRADLEDLDSLDEEYGHVEIGDGRVAVVCRDGSGIYDVERRLKQVWGDRLGIVALAKDSNHYTLRRSASLAAIDLHRAYDRLNQMDPAVDGRPVTKRWGGSDEIGGSPRPVGTSLEPSAILRGLRTAYARPERREVLRLGLVAVAWGVLIGGIALAASWGWDYRFDAPRTPTEHAARLAAVALAMALVTGLGLAVVARGRPWRFGLRRGAGDDWVALLPALLVGAAAGGVWVPATIDWTPRGLGAAAGSMAAIALAVTLWIPCLVHGVLARRLRIQLPRGRWFLSTPALTSAAVYAAFTAACGRLLVAAPPAALVRWTEGGGLIIQGLAAFAVGLCVSMVRERSLGFVFAAATLFLGGLVRLLVTLI